MPRIYISEPNHVYTFELPVTPGAEILIGTSPQCRLSLPGVGGLAEVHARIICQPQGYLIVDMGSTYGTIANGRPVSSEYMMPGVEYRLGAARIQFDAGMPQAQQQPAAAPVQQQAQPAAAAPAAKAPVKVAKVKKASSLKTGGAAAQQEENQDLQSLAAKFDRSKGSSGSRAVMIYVVLVLAAAFYAGLALHHWERTGNFLPGIQPTETEPVAKAPAAKKAEDDAQPAQSESAADDEETPEPASGESEENGSEETDTAPDDAEPSGASEDSTEEGSSDDDDTEEGEPEPADEQ